MTAGPVAEGGGVSGLTRPNTPTLRATRGSHQPRAQLALAAALKAGPSHAYLFRGPRGAGKREMARAFVAEILAEGATDPDDARRRAMLDPSPHPDLVWLQPRGAQHMVDEVRERVIRAASYRPFEGEKRVFVIEAAEAMKDESQNALLKTLEEPPDFVHILLLSSEPAQLLETIASRCQPIDFAPLPVEAVEASLPADAPADEVAAVARLSAGDLDQARFLLTDAGRRLRASVLDWKQMLTSAEAAGEEAEDTTRQALEDEAEAGVKRSAKDIADEAKRVGRRRRTEVLDLGLELTGSWYRDLAVTAAGAEEAVFNCDRLDELRREAGDLDPSRPRLAVELVEDTRRRLDLNVSEELALEALSFRLAAVMP
jgi:DNA polymerase III subunit delta'